MSIIRYNGKFQRNNQINGFAVLFLIVLIIGAGIFIGNFLSNENSNQKNNQTQNHNGFKYQPPIGFKNETQQ